MKTNYLKSVALMAALLVASSMPVWAAEIDDKTEAAAKNSYVFKTYLNTDDVNVNSKDGIVTLSGTVEQASHKKLAQETVENLPGVKSVDNRLELKAGTPAEKSNEWIAMNIKTALLFHRNVSVADTQVYVEEGIVTLRGEASTEAQKELTAEYADVDGVREVKNEMTVATAPKDAKQPKQEKIDDASITAQIKMALLTHRSTSAIKTSVATEEGIVTLGGNAKNAAEKDLVTKIVSDISGVKSTVNNMSISAPATN